MTMKEAEKAQQLLKAYNDAKDYEALARDLYEQKDIEKLARLALSLADALIALRRNEIYEFQTINPNNK